MSMQALDLENNVQQPSEQMTAAELEQFQRDGYFIARGLAHPALLKRMQEVTLQGLRDGTPPLEYEAELNYPGAPASLNERGGRTIRRLKQAYGRDPVFTEWVTSPGLVSRLAQILGPEVVMPLAHHNCIMTKQPQFSSDTGWHQDIRYWSFERPELVNVWLALGAEYPQNGCLKVLRGTHVAPVSREQLDSELFLRTDLPQNQNLIEQQVVVELQPGDALFFHCRTFHAATRNHTGEPKFSAVFTFRPGDNPPVPGSRSAALPEITILPAAATTPPPQNNNQH